MKDKILYISKKFLKHELITGSFFMFLGSIFSAFLAFILNLFFARNLSTADYGIYASLLSFFTLVALTPAQSISTVIIKFATNFISQNKMGLATSFYKKTLKYLFMFSITLFVLISIFSFPIKEFLRIDNIWYIILTGVAVFVYYLYIPNGAFTQSLLKFSFISFALVSSAVVRLIAGIVLVTLGFRVFGALAAIILAGITFFILYFIPIRKLFSKKEKNKDSIKVREILFYALPTGLSILALTSLTSMDVILVKHFFNSSQAGFYGGLSLIGKVIFYFTGSIPLVMFPLVVKRRANGENIASLFYLAMFLVTIPSIAITSFYYVLPNFSISFFLGNNYLSIAPYLGMFGIFITIYSMLNVCINFFLSIGKTKVFIPVIVAMIIQVILIYIFHSSFFQVIGVSLGVASLLLAYLLIVFAKDYINIKTIKKYLVISNSPGA